MVHISQVEPGPLRTVLSGCLPIEVHKEMIVPREVVDQARTDTKNLLLAVREARPVHLGLGDLLEVIAVDPEAQPIR
jgi:hypothetical protein